MQTGPGDILFFFFNDTATTEIYTLSLHDALPICGKARSCRADAGIRQSPCTSQHSGQLDPPRSEEHTLNSSHSQISYAVFCLKKKTSGKGHGSAATDDAHHRIEEPVDDVAAPDHV